MPRLALVVVLVVVLGVALTGCGGGGPSLASFCALIKKDNQVFKQIGGTKDAVKKASAVMKDLAVKAPNGIKDDVKTLSNAFDKVAAGDVASIRGDAAKFTAASKRVAVYTKQQCGFDLDATS